METFIFAATVLSVPASIITIGLFVQSVLRSQRKNDEDEQDR